MTSLRLRLFFLIAAATVIVWSTAAVWTTVKAQGDIERVLDRRLREAAHMVASLGTVALAAPPSRLPVATADYERQLSCQVWSVQGRLVGRSSSAPVTPLAGGEPGYSQRTIDGVDWRVYTYIAPGNGLRVMVGDTLLMRRNLVSDLMTGLIVPAAFGLLALAILIWIGIGRGLAPLNRVARAVEQREPHDPFPLSVREVPGELAGIISAIDALFARIAALRDNERHFLASAAHELQTPLAGLKTQADIARRSDDPAIRSNALQKIEMSVDRTTRLVRQLLDLARQEGCPGVTSHAPQPVVAVLALIREQLAPLIERRQDTLVFDPSVLRACVPMPEETLLIVLRNLIENAAIYGPDGQAITVSFEETLDETFLLVDDEGPGLSDSAAAALRQPFARGKRETAPGSGLGLSIVDMALSRVGAQLRFERGRSGTRARIVFPRGAPVTSS